MAKTSIEWCDKSWNPISGCSPISEGCTNCYAKRMAYRLKGRYGYPKDDPFRVTFHPDRLDEPLHWKKPSRIFVVSMGDLFHKDISVIWIEKVFQSMVSANWHKYLILTKRPSEAMKIAGWIKNLSDNVDLMLGVSISTNKDLWMVKTLLQIPAAKRFVSVEPMLEPIDIYPTPMHQGDKCLDWIICGGETGPKARSMSLDWARDLRDKCKAANVPFFMKQITNKKAIPKDLMIREFPK